MTFSLLLHNLPFEALEHQVIYTEGCYDQVINDYILRHYDEIRESFANEGYEFCYLPKLSERLWEAETIFYNAPYAQAEGHARPVRSDFILDYLYSPEKKTELSPMLLYYPWWLPHDEGGLSEYLGISLSAETIAEDLKSALDKVAHGLLYEEQEGEPLGHLEEAPCDGIRFRIGDKDEVQGISGLEDLSEGKEKRRQTRYGMTLPWKRPERDRAEELFDSESTKLAEEICERIDKLQQRGITWYMLEQYINQKETLSRLLITEDYRIFLPDYNNIEIEMYPLPKAVFLLFLQHPEGIIFSFLPDYYEELKMLYSQLKPSSESSASTKSLRDLTDHTKNSINEKCAVIRSAFVSKFDERLARNYFITGARSEPKRITLPRELVEWRR